MQFKKLSVPVSPQQTNVFENVVIRPVVSNLNYVQRRATVEIWVYPNTEATNPMANIGSMTFSGEKFDSMFEFINLSTGEFLKDAVPMLRAWEFPNGKISIG